MSMGMEYTDKDVEAIRKGEDPSKLAGDEGAAPPKDQEQAPKESKAEKQARASGWTSLEEWEKRGKSADDWVDAPEFVRRGELMDRIKSQTKELKSTKGRMSELEKAIKTLGEHNKKIAQVEFERAKKILTAKKVEAMDDRDHAAVIAIDEKLDELTDQANAATETDVLPEETATDVPQVPAPVSDWVNRPENAWYREDPALQAAADALATAYGKKHFDPATPAEEQPWEELLEAVETQMQQKFPQYFEGEDDFEEDNPPPKKRTTRKRVAEPGQTGRRSAKKTKLRLSDLNDEERSAYNEFVNRQKIMSGDEYLAQLEALNSAS